MTTHLKNPYVLGYVHLHNKEEVAEFRQAMKDLKIDFYDDWGEVSEGKKHCDNCAWEVRDHEGADRKCPGQEKDNDR